MSGHCEPDPAMCYAIMLQYLVLSEGHFQSAVLFSDGLTVLASYFWSFNIVRDS